MTFKLKAGFSVQQADANGAIIFPEIVGDPIEIPLFDQAMNVIVRGLGAMTLFMMLI